MSKGERSWAVRYGIILAILLTLPYFIGYFSETDEWRFTGFVFGVEDGNSYIAKMLSGSEGAWYFRTPYSTMNQRGVLAFLPYLLIGKLAAGPGIHEQLVVLFHLFRALVTPFTVVATYRFISLFVKDIEWRKWGTILSTVGGGLGWLLVLIGRGFWFESLPMDWISPEWFGFLTYFGTPHLILARGLLLTGLTYYLSSPLASSRVWYSGLCFCFSGLVHPLSLVTAIAILFVHQIGIGIVAAVRKSWRSLRKWLWIGMRVILLPAPLTIYYVIKFSTDPYLKVWTEQNRIFSPHPLHALAAYGLILIPAVLGMLRVVNSKRWTSLLLVTWAFAFPIFAYAPHNLQRRLPEGIWVVWLTLTALGLRDPGKYLPKKQLVWRTILLGLSIPTTIMLFMSSLLVSRQTTVPIFRPADEVAVFERLRESADVGSVVLSAFETGNALPAWSPMTVVIGHGPETANNSFIRSEVEKFYSGGMLPEDQIQFLVSQNVNFVIAGPQERKFGEVDLTESSSYQLKFEIGEYQLFEVIR